MRLLPGVHSSMLNELCNNNKHSASNKYTKKMNEENYKVNDVDDNENKNNNINIITTH